MVEELAFKFVGYNLLGNIIRDVANDLGGLLGMVGGFGGKMGSAFTQVGAAGMEMGTALFSAGVLMAAGMGAAAEHAAKFESQLILLHTQAFDKVGVIDEYRNAIFRMAPVLGFTTMELAKAAYQIESTGYAGSTAAQRIEVLRVAAMGAAVGHADLVKTTIALSSILANYPEYVAKPISAMGMLDAIVGSGRMTMEELNGALATGLPSAARIAGVSLQDMGGALATMTDLGNP